MPPQNVYNGQKPENDNPSIISRLITPVGVIILVLIVALLVTRRGDDADDTRDQAREARTISVDLAPVATKTLRETVHGVGTLNPIQTVQVKPEVNGKLVSVNFEEGGHVKKGQVLFEIEDEKITKHYEARKAALESARIRLANLQRNYERISTLRERNLVSEDQYDNVKTELDAVTSDIERLTIELELAEREVRDASVRAPFDGYISRQLVDPGTFVTIGHPLAMVYETDPLQVSFFVSEKYAGRVSKGQTVRVTVAAFPDRPFKGTVDFISPVIDEGTRKFRVRANIDNPEGILKPGAFAAAELVLALRDERPIIPEQALVATREGFIVYIVDPSSNAAHSREVQTGLREAGFVEITAGVSPNELVVIYGHMQLDEGFSVRINHTWEPDWAAGAGPGDSNVKGG